VVVRAAASWPVGLTVAFQKPRPLPAVYNVSADVARICAKSRSCAEALCEEQQRSEKYVRWGSAVVVPRQAVGESRFSLMPIAAACQLPAPVGSAMGGVGEAGGGGSGITRRGVVLRAATHECRLAHPATRTAVVAAPAVLDAGVVRPSAR